MNISWNQILPIIIGIIFALNIYLILRVAVVTLTTLRLKLRRVDIVRSYQVFGNLKIKKPSRQLKAARVLIEGYGNQLVRKSYRGKLEKLLINSGDWEGRKYSSLVERKIVYAAVGFLVGLLILIAGNLQFLPFLIVFVLAAYFFPDIEKLFQRVTGRKYKSKLAKLLNQAGDWKEADYFTLIRRKFNFSLGSFILSYLYLLLKNGSVSSLFFTFIAIFFGFFIPDLLLQNKVIKRKEILATTLPDAIDMLQMCVGAGLAFPAALSKVAETQSGPLADEFSRVMAEVQLGQARSDALQAMAERTQEKHVKKFVSAMLQVDRFGIPVGNVLIEQSAEMRSARRERARERGQKVPVKILAPIMLCFLPTVLIIILGPAVISIMHAFSHR